MFNESGEGGQELVGGEILAESQMYSFGGEVHEDGCIYFAVDRFSCVSLSDGGPVPVYLLWLEQLSKKLRLGVQEVLQCSIQRCVDGAFNIHSSIC